MTPGRLVDGSPSYLVSIGEGRRQGLRLLAKRKAIKRTHPVRVIVDAENDAHEISLDENMTREAMHPADQFEAFQRLAVEKGCRPKRMRGWRRSTRACRPSVRTSTTPPRPRPGRGSW